MLTGLVFPIFASYYRDLNLEKNCRKESDQTFWTIRGGLHLGLQGVFISGKNLFSELMTPIASAKIAIIYE